MFGASRAAGGDAESGCGAGCRLASASHDGEVAAHEFGELGPVARGATPGNESRTWPIKSDSPEEDENANNPNRLSRLQQRTRA